MNTNEDDNEFDMGTALKINVFNSQLCGSKKSHDTRLAQKTITSHNLLKNSCDTRLAQKTIVIHDLLKKILYFE